jgi:hypothetical protein
MRISSSPQQPQCVLPDEARRRLSNQIARAYRGTFGARAGLRTLACSIARRMVRAGWSPAAVSAALARVVANDPASTSADGRNVAAAESRSIELLELMRECIAEVELELSQTPPP